MQATSSSLNTLWHHLEDSKLRKTQQTFGLNLRCSLHVFCFVLVLFLKAQRLSPTRRPEKPKLLFPLQPTSCNHQQAAIECLGVDTAGFETLLTVIFFAIGFLMLQATQPRASPKEGNGEKYRHWSAGAKPTVSAGTSSHLSAMNFRWSQSAPKRPIEWDFVPMCG
ncbi:unnamed protein product [Cladocopium goreaui]|uniref:Uncharacterized protein n=1 Tax=Cladocopium goreaui TaxID=2562237 RepID=A0A9P1CFU0_9DINO|nr:unnamed protein product [Cladocopium goreaui]